MDIEESISVRRYCTLDEKMGIRIAAELTQRGEDNKLTFVLQSTTQAVMFDDAIAEKAAEFITEVLETMHETEGVE